MIVAASFIKNKPNVLGTGTTAANSSRLPKDDSVTAVERSSTKPTPPPKNFTTPTSNSGCKSKVPNSKELPSRSVEKKQRPLSQIELKTGIDLKYFILKIN